MSTNDSWTVYARLQNLLQKSVRVSNFSLALEETLSVLIESIAGGREISEIQIDNLIKNRSAKYRQRRKYNEIATPPYLGDGQRSLNARIELRERLGRCSTRDQSIMIAIGRGVTTREIALASLTPEGTIKTRFRRGRLKFAA
jgi:DNA-binding NarL/FixJ family response regulator